jgi:hypothetical protein
MWKAQVMNAMSVMMSHLQQENPDYENMIRSVKELDTDLRRQEFAPRVNDDLRLMNNSVAIVRHEVERLRSALSLHDCTKTLDCVATVETALRQELD